jgi:PIN domain nuclease of toxin-antitoxin system
LNLLLDTHAFLWWMTDDPRLSPKAHRLVADPANRIHLSAAAAWEISTKHRIGKLPEARRVMPRFMAALAEAMIEPLPVSVEHALAAGAYAARHRDPFERVMAAQAQIEDMPILTNDGAFRQFPVRTVW